jgi:ribosomal protein L11 methylase PrmA
MIETFLWVMLGVALALLLWQTSLVISVIFGAPTVHTQKSVIIEAYKLADLKKNETVLDLGCSDARALIYGVKKFGAKGIGVEISPFYFLKAKLAVLLSGQRRKIQIIFGNLKNSGELIKRSDVIYLYLLPKLLDEIEPKIFKYLKGNARVVTVGFYFKNKKTKFQKMVTNHGRKTKIYLYHI